MDLSGTSLDSSVKLFHYYRVLGQKAIDQVSEPGLFWSFNEESNSIAVIVKHLHGNMLSRWTDFLTTDGEKDWRNRDEEFKADIRNRQELQSLWDEGWDCLFNAIKNLDENDLKRIVYIRKQEYTVLVAIHRQLAHYAYHVGQIVYVAKIKSNEQWQSLSIPRNRSIQYNTQKQKPGRHGGHFTDEFKS
jgi:hypothetical protein